MRRMAIRSTITALFLVMLAGLVPAALANNVTWVLSGVTFQDGGTASGSFVYDADTNTVSSVGITTTAGTLFAGATYTGINNPTILPPTASSITFITNPSLLDLAGTPGLILVFFSALTDLGGTSAIFVPNAGEVTCLNPTNICADTSTLRFITGGEVVSGAVSVSAPEPASILLLGTGLLGLMGTGLYKKRLA